MSEKIRENKLAAEKGEQIDLGRLLGAFLDNRWMIVCAVTTFGILGILYSLFATPVYRADALIQVEQNVGNTLLNDLSQVLPSSQPESAAEIELIKSRMVLGKTVQELGLDTITSQKYYPLFGRGWARIMKVKPAQIVVSKLNLDEEYTNEPLQLEVINDKQYILTDYDGKKINGHIGKLVEFGQNKIFIDSINAEKNTVFTLQKISKLEAINNLLVNFNVADKGKDTGVLALTLTGNNPVLIQKILDSISKNYLEQNIDRKSEEAAKSLMFLKAQLPKVRADLNISENKLNKYRQANDSVDVPLEAKSVLDSLVSIDTQLNELTFKEAEISKLYTKEHPTYKALLEKRQILEDEKDKLNKRVSNMPKTQQEILRLTQDVQVGQAVYMQLMNKQQELSISKASTIGNVRIIDDAIAQPRAIRPQKTIIILLSMIFGAIVSFSIVVIKVIVRKGIENPEQLEEAGMSVYASVPLSEWQAKNHKQISTRNNRKGHHQSSNIKTETLLSIVNPTDLAVEAIRSLRTSLHFAMLEAKNNVVMISGASPAAGKSFICMNLSVVIAQAGQKVLIIDSDMRKGYLHEMLGLNYEKGLSDILSKKIEVHEAIKKTNIPNLDVITRGITPPNPSELLMHPRLGELLTSVTTQYDIILIDTPPILAVTDAAITGRNVGTTLIVARFEYNTVKEIEVSKRRFEQNGIEVKGVILNAVIRRASSYYGYNYGYYQYEYDKK
ncbi:tyrosine-protein kinase Wzc [Acerihabitans sp. TG2]|uniref:tyrosine-protein kinase Wzc n=1 Tax=Acerihabitans sp. TG2 TaxID=3096008 RepID=UPI002B22AF5F|nr:tyrosine-protein kinase Wzc [Acerihabitans sp. TG2]MEA9389284.1 tyrosine-protein kinase Wzc [Acerihabitans sp. TG2]